MQLKITSASFPDNPDDIRLYSCLANGTSEEYTKGEQLYANKCVKNLLQIGFHLSALVNCNQNSIKQSQTFNVAIVCDRKKITSCHCNCSKQNSWCLHIVAVCLSRINEPQNVELRAPVSESLAKLNRDQLQKFAQYLISELPQQILPTAQKLLDELLKSNQSTINLTSGAPDPTAGPSVDEISVWCLDEFQLQENIKKTLSKFIQPTPHVVSDVDYLAHSSSNTSNEYTSLLRPLRGREPEALWNLISIIKEMFRKRDKNSIPLLKIMTDECMMLDQMINLWFMIKASPLYTSSNQSTSRSSQNQIPPAHQACASLLDEIVSLWRVLCLNPILSNEERLKFKDLLINWQRNVFEKLKHFLNVNQDRASLLSRLDIRYFPGFSPALDACQIDWSHFDLKSIELFKHECHKELNYKPEDKSVIKMSLSSSDDAFEDNKSPPTHDITAPNDDTNIYLYDYEKLRSNMIKPKQQESQFYTSKVNFDILEVLFSRCEALYIHGFDEQAVILATILSEYLLNNEFLSESSTLTNDFYTSSIRRCSLVCAILLDHFEHHSQAFKIGIYGLEACRQPANSKALEVKLFNQEHELCNLLKRMQLGQNEILLLKDRAKKLKDLELSKCKGNCLLPLILAGYIFEILCLNDYGRSNPTDELLGFEAAITALGLKTNLNETQYPILCEGLRRQKGDLALTLLLTYKDDQSRLVRIMDKLLDKETHVLFKTPINPFQPNLKKIQQNQQQSQQQPLKSSNISSQTVPYTKSTEVPKPTPKYSTVDSLSSGWDESENECPTHNLNLLEAKVKCMNIKQSNKKGSSLESSPQETTSSDNSPTLNRKTQNKPLNHLQVQSTITTEEHTQMNENETNINQEKSCEYETKIENFSSLTTTAQDNKCEKSQFIIGGDVRIKTL